MFDQHQHGWRRGVMGATLMILSACKYQAEDAPAAQAPVTPSTPTPTAPSAYARDAAPQVSTSGPLTLERYADTTAAVGGASTSAQNSLIHEESKP